MKFSGSSRVLLHRLSGTVCVVALMLTAGCADRPKLDITATGSITESGDVVPAAEPGVRKVAGPSRRPTLMGWLDSSAASRSQTTKIHRTAEPAPADSDVDTVKTGTISAVPVEPARTRKTVENTRALAGFTPKSGRKRTLFGWFGGGKAKDLADGSQTANTDAQGHDLALNTVVAETMRTNPDIGIVAAQVEDAKVGVEIENAGRRPTIDLSAMTGVENTYTETNASEGTHRSELSLSMEYVVYDFGSGANAVKRKRDLVNSAELRRMDKNEEISLSIISAYLEYRRNEELVAAAERNVGNHERIAKLVTLNEEGGNATVADVKRAQTRLETANTDKLNAENARADATAAFRRLTGMSPHDVKVPDVLAPNSVARELSEIESLILANPQLRSLTADRTSLESQLDQQRASLKPEVFLRGEANYKYNVAGENGAASDFKGMVGVRMRLFDGGKRRREMEQIGARIDEVDQRYRKLYRELLQQMEQNNQALSTEEKKAGFLQERVATAQKAMNLYRDQFEAGERSAFELLDAQRDVYQAEKEKINHRFDAATAIYQNLRLRGDLVSTLKDGE